MKDSILKKIGANKVVSVFFALALSLAITCGCNATQVSSDNSGTQNVSVEQQQAPTNIILVRHGQTDYNVQERLQGQIDIQLNENGMQQANAF